jgi:hypothetical protein
LNFRSCRLVDLADLWNQSRLVHSPKARALTKPTTPPATFCVSYATFVFTLIAFGINLFRNQICPIAYFTSDDYRITLIQALGFHCDIVPIENAARPIMLSVINELSRVPLRMHYKRGACLQMKWGKVSVLLTIGMSSAIISVTYKSKGHIR